ncbi:MAG: DUF11 domain-containing protein [Lachnospiraceae bacterium]|nr:DUF11 domain-containing protein [Lachnospiraceae bacterium]
MQDLVTKYLENFKMERRTKRRLGGILLVLALVVTMGVYWQLKLTGAALTNESYCGKEEHQHSDDCYEWVLVCGYDDAEESAADASEAQTEAETSGHTHTAECYETVTTLVCGLEDTEGESETGEEHTHDESCYVTEEVLICGQEETAEETSAADTASTVSKTAHVHTEACYEKVLVCGLEEHTHSIECMSNDTADVETAADWEATLPSDISDDWAEAVAAVAASQLGYTESTANFVLGDDGETRRGYTRYGAWAGNEYGDWDAMFVSFCLHYAGISTEDFPESTGAYAWIVMLNEHGLYTNASEYTPVMGDLVFFDTDEDGKADCVGIVTSVDEEAGQLIVIEGDYAADADAADAVCANQYALSDSRIVGFGLVSAAQEESAAAEELTWQTLTVTVDDVTVTVSGMLPEGSSVSAEQVPVELEGLDVHVALEISILLEDGTAYEPEEDTLAVAIESPEITSSDSVYYVPEEGSPEKVTTNAITGYAEFDAEHFSTYVIAGDEDDDGDTTTASIISTTYTDASGNEATLTISSSSDTSLLTGQWVSLSITLGLHGNVDLSSGSARVYLTSSDTDLSVYGSTGGTDAWTVDEAKPYYITGTTTQIYVTLRQDENGAYYLEIDSEGAMQAGQTVNFNMSIGYPNETSDGGTVTVSGAVGTSTSSGTLGFTWTYQTDTYGVTKKTSGTPSFVSDADDDKIYLTGLAYTVTSTRSSASSYGKNPVATFTYTDTLVLPEGLSWRDGLLTAISSESYGINGKTVEVYIDGTTYTLCTVSPGQDNYLQNLDVSVVGDSIVVTWSFASGSEQWETSFLSKSYTITYGDQVIVCETGEDGAYSAGSYDLTNTVTADYSFKLTERHQTATDDATATATLSEGALKLTKTTTADTFYMGSSYEFTITAENPEAMPYSGLARIEDRLDDWFYIEPDEMERLLTEYSDSLTITISKATLYDAVSETVTDVYGDGTKTVTQQEQGIGTTYTGEKYGSGTLISSDSVKSATETINLYRDQADGLIYMSVGTDLYTIGEGEKYTSLSAALDAIGYYVTNATTYTLRWDLGEDYTLNGSTKLEYTYTATVKDTFMRLIGDQFYDLNQSSSEYWTQDNVLVGGTATNTVSALDENDESLKEAEVSGNVYRDFVLTKGYMVSDSSLTTGSIVTYTVNVKHEGTASYDALPLVDQLADGQILLVPVSENSSNSSLDGLDTTTVNGIKYYVLDQAGTYENVKINSDVTANRIVVKSDGSTLIYCYLVVKGEGTTSIKYTTLVDAADASGFSLKNQVWLNDHETHRLYAETSVDGSVLSIDKHIVPEKGSSPSEDGTVTSSILSGGGEVVTYRLELKNNSDTEITITGDNVYDTLPVNVSGDLWNADADIKISVVLSESAEVTGNWATDWSVTTVEPGSESTENPDATQCYIVWASSDTLTFTGSVYIYVTLIYPDGEEWTSYYNAYRSTTLKNTFHAYALESEVAHSISTATKATLFKGVYATGLATNKTYLATFYSGASENSLTYYTNDSAGEYGYVQYYVVLYNEGPVNLYLQDMTDTLPDGFSYISSSAAPAADIAVYNTAGEVMEVVTGYTVMGTASSGTVTFTLSGGNLCQDTSNSMYYLEPGQAIVFTYKVLTGAYLNTSNTETNTISMPFYDYTSGGLTLSDDVSGETVTGDWYDAATDPKNDGDCEIVTEEDDDGNTTYSLTSTVNVYRNQIRPGITKSATTDKATESDTITWKVTVTNDGESTMAGYYIYDVIKDPYTFTGSLTYTVYDSEGNSTTYTIGTLSMSDDLSTLRIYGYTGSTGSTSTRSLSESAKEVYAYVGSTYSTRYLVELSAWKNSDGNWVLCVYFPTYTSTSGYKDRTSRAFAIPSGGKGILTVSTNNTGTSQNMILTNDAYIVPDQSFERYHVGDGVEIPAGSGDPIVGNDHAVEAEAMVPINYGYATTSSKSVAEIDEDGNVKGEASSSGSLDSLQLTSSDSIIRYTLSVTNGNKEMTQLVLVDTLPEPDDTDPLTTAQRYSDFTVSLADDPDFEVVVTAADGTVLYTLTEDNYTVVYSDETSFSADDLNGTDESKWFSTKSSRTRSFRVTLVFDKNFTSIPANATVTVAFSAKIDGTATDGVAWNSFSYLYSSETSTGNEAHEATATPIPVGIKAPNIPVLAKQVLDADNNTVSLTNETTYSFLIYQGDTLTDVDTSDIQALYKALSEDGYTFTEVSLTVAAGKGTTSKTLENLVQYTASVDSEGVYNATAGTTDWTWTNNTSYTIVELTQDADYPFHTWSDSSDTYTTNSCTFTYSNSSVLTLTCSNQEVTYDLPKTGGTGTGLFTLLGLMLCGGAAMLLFFRRRWV